MVAFFTDKHPILLRNWSNGILATAVGETYLDFTLKMSNVSDVTFCLGPLIWRAVPTVFFATNCFRLSLFVIDLTLQCTEKLQITKEAKEAIVAALKVITIK